MGHRTEDAPGGHEGANRFYFTEDALAARRPGQRRITLTDTGKVRGLQLIIYPTGKRSFFWRRKLGYVSYRIKLGEFLIGGRGMSVSLARQKAEAYNGKCARGEDPGAEHAAVRHELRVGELYKQWLSEHMEPHRRAHSIANAKQLWKAYLAPALANHKLSRLTRGTVATLHQKIGLTTPVQANRAIEALSSMCSFALDREIAPARWNGVNPCARIKSFREVPRKRFLGQDELPRFLDALDGEPSPDLRDFFTMLLLTGARRSNVAAMKWSDVDLVSGTWSVAAAEAKGGEEMKLALTSAAVELLNRRRGEAEELIARVEARTLNPVPKMTFREAKRWRSEGRRAAHAATFVFPGVGATGHLVEPKAAWSKLLERGGISDLRIHDLRRTMGAWLAAGGANAFAIQKALGHRSLAATAVYAQLDLTSVRAVMEGVGEAMREVTARAHEEAAKVTEIKHLGRSA